MKFFAPIEITDAMLTSSIPETDYAAWDAATAYAKGDKVIRATTHRIYENLVAGTDATLPENATGGDTPRWLDIGPTNRWAMFDGELGSASTATDSLVVTLAPGQPFDSLGLVELVGASVEVVVRSSAGGTVVYSRTVTLDGTEITSFGDWFFAPFVQQDSLALTDIPSSYFAPEITITITRAGSVSVGALLIGMASDLGAVQVEPKLGIVSYSRKETNEFGRVTVVPRRKVKTLDCTVIMHEVSLSKAYKALEAATDIPCVWIASESQKLAPLTIYGFYKDFSIDVAHPSINLYYCSLTVEGII